MSESAGNIFGAGKRPRLVTIPSRDGAATLRLLDLRELDVVGDGGRSLLTERELVEYEKFGSPQRKAHWFGARVCLKSALMEAGRIGTPLECEIVKDELGRPSIKEFSCDGSRWDCSLSHTGAYAFAAFYRRVGGRIGIDIEEISPRAGRLKDAFLNRMDSLIMDSSDPSYYTTLWSVKESVSKAVGTGLGIGFRRLVCRGSEPGVCRVETESLFVEAEYSVYDGCVVAAAFSGRTRR